MPHRGFTCLLRWCRANRFTWADRCVAAAEPRAGFGGWTAGIPLDEAGVPRRDRGADRHRGDWWAGPADIIRARLPKLASLLGRLARATRSDGLPPVRRVRQPPAYQPGRHRDRK